MRKPIEDKEHILLQELGNKLRKYRKKLKLTQEELAEQTGVDRRTISNLENGKANPSFTTLYRLLDCLHIPTDYLFYQTMDSPVDAMTQIRIDLNGCTETELKMLHRYIEFQILMMRQQEE